MRTEKSIKEERRMARVMEIFLRLLLFNVFTAILRVTFRLLFLSIKVTSFRRTTAHKPSVFNPYNPVSHLGNVIIMGD